jgi:REP element-mobilizing transposase RayT
MITRACTQQQFLLRPDEATTNAFIYCLAIAARMFGIIILYTLAESNHHHTVIFDPHGYVSAFVENFHKLVARSQNVLRGRWENFWAAEEPCITRLLDRQAVIEALIYAASNPVKDRLVERAHQWPGANAYSAFIHGRVMKATRPLHFFRNPGPMPKEVTLDLVIPPELGPADEVIREVREGVEAVENRVRLERQATGAGVLGRRRAMALSWKDSSTTVKPRRGLRPRFAGAIKVRVEALARYRAFLHAYKRARIRWLDGLDALFPKGTYWLSRFAFIRVDETA